MSESPVERAREAVQGARAAASEAVESSEEAERQLEAIDRGEARGPEDQDAVGGVDHSGGGGPSGGGTTND